MSCSVKTNAWFEDSWSPFLLHKQHVKNGNTNVQDSNREVTQNLVPVNLE